MIVSPSESPAFHALGRSSWRCEEWGVDALWSARGLWYGVQRKALKDLVVSVEDGRLAKERLQWASVSGQVWLIVETGERGGGAPREMPNGQLAALGTFGRPWTGQALRALTFSIMGDGVGVCWTADEAGTIGLVRELHAWSMKERHESARGRPTCPPDVFGNRDDRAYGVWLLSSLPRVGPEMAGRIWDHFGGLPIKLDCTVDDLMQVEGVGRVTAEGIVRVFKEA